MSPTHLNLLRQSAARGLVTGTVARGSFPRIAVASHARFQSSSGPTPATESSKSVKGPSGAEASAQGSDQRGKATSYALPIVAVSLVAFALVVRLSSKDSKQSAVNVGIGTEGASKLKGSKAKGIADAAASKKVDENIK